MPKQKPLKFSRKDPATFWENQQLLSTKVFDKPYKITTMDKFILRKAMN